MNIVQLLQSLTTSAVSRSLGEILLLKLNYTRQLFGNFIIISAASNYVIPYTLQTCILMS